MQVDRHVQRVHYVAGASGVGTSTRAFSLRRAWEQRSSARPVLVLATDVVRAQLRTVLREDEHPDLFGESFNLRAGADDDLRDGVSVSAFLRQCAPILRAVEVGVAYALSEGWDVIVEGVHLVPGAFSTPPIDAADVTHELLTIDDEQLHRDRFHARDAASEGRRPAAHYVANLPRIRVIQDELRARAVAAGWLA